jgi:hypothetical protein
MSDEVTRRPEPVGEAADPWASLRRLTAARIGLQRVPLIVAHSLNA